MQAVKSSGSLIEKKLSIALWNLGYRYRKNDRNVFGKPDLTFKKYKIAVFADSEFWHGKNWKNRKNDFKTNKKFWIKKIEGNINRDKIVNKKLKNEGWKVIRFWGEEIKKDLQKCIIKFENTLNEIKEKN
jgi:T/G mismatch-specific endonuclease (EC 3.1.-.-)